MIFLLVFQTSTGSESGNRLNEVRIISFVDKKRSYYNSPVFYFFKRFFLFYIKTSWAV